MSLDVPGGCNAQPAAPQQTARTRLGANPEATPAAPFRLAGTGGAAGPLPQLIEQLRRGEPPIPLMNGQALAQALRLHRAGWTYGQIARVMATYHGMELVPAGTWRSRLRKLGAEPRAHKNGVRRVPPASPWKRKATA